MNPCDSCGIELVTQPTWKKLDPVERECYRRARTLAPIAARHPYRLCKRCWTADKRRREQERAEHFAMKRMAEYALDWESVKVGGITYWQKPNESRADFIERANRSRKRVNA